VFDELTRLKNPSGARFKALNKVIDKMGVRWGLTGSFTSNGLEDVFGQCKIVDQKLLGRSKGAFMQQYFVLMNPEYGEWMPRPGSLKRVMDVIKPATYVLEPGEYADKLPPCHMIEMRCDMVMTEYNTMKKDFVVQFGESQIAAINAAVVTGKLQQMASGFVYDTTSVASDAPGKFAVTQTPIWFSKHKFDALDDLLQENQRANTIIAYNYREELAELKRRYKHAVTLDDDRAIERWNKGDVELLLVHPKSAGHGLNLQHGGCRMVFLSLPWSLELFEQTIGRLHRSGQQHDVWVYVMLTNKTVDEKIWGALHDKRAVSDIAMEALK
jgi:SNF2 family DNA or RNA helicase